jgi:hypothetical protein
MKKVKNIKKSIFIVFVSIVGTLSAQEHSNDEPFFKEPLIRDTSISKLLISASWSFWGNPGGFNCAIDFLKDQTGSQFVVKRQPTKEYSIHEVLGARIGQTLGKNFVNKVIPAPANLVAPYGIATLHTHAIGTETSNYDYALENKINIQNGLASKLNLSSITYNEDLAKLVAFHLYLDDRDCHSNNLFYDFESDHFCAIDKGLIFPTSYYFAEHQNDLNRVFPMHCVRDGQSNQLLATSACDFLETVQKDNLSSKEINALKVVSTTLISLMAAYPPAKIHTEWMTLAEDLDFKYSDETKENISILVEYNHHENKRLVKLIDKLTQ